MGTDFGRALRVAGRAALVLIALGSLVLLLCEKGALPRPHRTVHLKPIRAEEGLAHTAKFPKLWSAFAVDSKSSILTEDGRPLRAVRENGIVREKGMGAYRIGSERVLFSSSDGTDPKHNGRTYVLRIESVVAPAIRPAIWCAGAFAALLLFCKNLVRFAAWSRRSAAGMSADLSHVSTRTTALWLFAGALAIRVGFLLLNPEYTDEQMAILGVPYSDAGGWNAMAKSTALGHGVDAAFPGMRALYPMFLANFYTWFGPSLDLAKALQAMFGALTCAVIFLVLRRAMPLWPALAGALFFAVDPRQVVQAAKLMTEPFGLLLTLVSAWCLIAGGEKRRPVLLFAAGAFFACANLTRPLTLFAFPFFITLIAANSWLRETTRWRSAILHSAAFAFGTILCLAPWVIRERVTHGIWAISSNSAPALYAASTPQFGTWSTEVEALPGEAGIKHHVHSRYVFFQERFRENLRKYPGFYAENVKRSFGIVAMGCDNLSPALYGAGLGALVIVVALGALRDGRRTAGVIALSLSLAVAGLALAHREWASGLALIGVVFTLWWRVFPAAALVVFHIGALLGSALFGNPDLQRMRLLADWLEAGWTFAGVFAMGSAAVALLLRIPVRSVAGASREWSDEPPPRVLRWIGGAFAAFLVISITRLVVLNAFTTHPPRPNPKLTDEQRTAFLQELTKRAPQWQRLAEPALMAAPRSWQRRVFVEFGSIDQEAFHFPANAGFKHWTGLFEPRPHNHTSFVFRVAGPSFAGSIWMEFGGEIPPIFRETKCLLIGLPKVRPVLTAYYDNSVEAVAIIPAPDFQPDFSRAIVAPLTPATEALLEAPAAPQ